MGLNREKEIVLETLDSVFKKYVYLNSASKGRPILQYVFRKVHWKIRNSDGGYKKQKRQGMRVHLDEDTFK
jgi:hypothetical protein